MLKSAVFGSSFGSLARAAGQLLAGAHRAGARAVDVEVRRVLRVRDERVRVRAAAGLHRGDLLRLLHVGDVEDADAAEPLVAHRRLDALRAAVDAAARLLDRHEEQVAVHRHVALAAGADDRRQQLRLLRVLDVVGVEAVEVADEEMVAAERQVGVGEVRARSPRRSAAVAGAASARRGLRQAQFGGCRRLPAWLRAPALGFRRRSARPPGVFGSKKPGGLRQARRRARCCAPPAPRPEARLEADARIVRRARPGWPAPAPGSAPRRTPPATTIIAAATTHAALASLITAPCPSASAASIARMRSISMR